MRHKTKSGHYVGVEFPTQSQLRQNYSALIRKINNPTSRLTAKQKHAAILKLDGITRQEMDGIIKSTGPKLAINLRRFVSAKRLAKLDKRNIICALKLKNGKPIHVEGQYEWPHKWNKKIVTFAVLRGTHDANAQDILRKAVGLAFSTWGAEIPVKFQRVKLTDNPDVTILFQNDPTADPYLKAKPTVLAYAYYPGTSKQGIIVFNDYKYNWGAKDQRISGKRIWNVNHVLCHEIGHSLGLPHDTSNPGADILDPYYNGGVYDLSENDIIRIQKKYGIRTFDDWNKYKRFKTYLAHRKRNL